MARAGWDNKREGIFAAPGDRRGAKTGTRRRRLGARTRDELYEEAKALNIAGRSKMDKPELEAALDRRRGRR